jgi:hypothetical protein
MNSAHLFSVNGGECRRVDRGLVRRAKAHARFLGAPTALAVIARRTSGHYIHPGVLPALVAWDHVVDRQAHFTAAAVLTCIIVATEYFPPGQLDARARAPHLMLQADDRRSRK